MNYQKIFENCTITQDTIFAAIQAGATEQELQNLVFQMKSEKVPLEGGGWFDKGNSTFLLYKSNTALTGKRVYRTRKGNVVIETERMEQVAGTMGTCMQNVSTYKIATEEDLAWFEQDANYFKEFRKSFDPKEEL